MKEATKSSLEEFVLVTRAHTSGGTQPGLQGWAEFADWTVRKKILIYIIQKCALTVAKKTHGRPIVIPVQQSKQILKQKILN